MITILISALVLWTVFGFFVLFNSVDDLTDFSKVNVLKLAFALGPVLVVSGILVGGFLIGIEKTVAWLKK